MNLEQTYTNETSHKAIDSLNNQLSLLQDKYSSYLNNEDVKYDVDCLVEWIESCRQGNINSEEWFAEYGESLIKNIKQKLELALVEQQRIDEESPNTNKSSNKKIDDLSKATNIAAKAERKIQKAIVEENINDNSNGGSYVLN